MSRWNGRRTRRCAAAAASRCVVDQIPADLLIRPAESAVPQPGDLCHAIPVDSRLVSPVLEDADETALARLDHALTGRMAPGAGDWPDRCAGPVGDTGEGH
ncbi:hypothetical protein ACWEKM_22945 [Streptomyces sp. NPDC004752]